MDDFSRESEMSLNGNARGKHGTGAGEQCCSCFHAVNGVGCRGIETPNWEETPEESKPTDEQEEEEPGFMDFPDNASPGATKVGHPGHHSRE